MAQVFISFVHEEIEWAECVQNFISLMFDSSAAPFMSSDKFQVYAGEKWLDRIMDELKEAKVVLLMLSENSVKRPWVNFEAGAAWTRNIVTIPICFGGLQKDNLPKPYSSLQAIDLQSWDDHEYLARSVAHHLGSLSRYHQCTVCTLWGAQTPRERLRDNRRPATYCEKSSRNCAAAQASHRLPR